MPYKINRLMLLERLEKQNLQVQPMLFKITTITQSQKRLEKQKFNGLKMIENVNSHSNNNIFCKAG